MIAKYIKSKSTLIIDWEDALKEIRESIQEAQKNIKIRMYMWRDDMSWRLIIWLLEKKITENPKIKIQIDKDAFWTKVYNFQKYVTFWRVWWDIFSSDCWKEFLKHTNVTLNYVWTSSILLFKYIKENDHSKVFIFDENTPKCKILIWWMNIADEYLKPQNRNNPDLWWWHDYMVKIEWKWHFSSPKQSKGIFSRKIMNWFSLFMNIKSKRNMRNEILREIWKAKRNIIIEHAYITDQKVIRKLRKISNKWVKVCLILPTMSDWVWHSNMNTAKKLLKPWIINRKSHRNIKIYLYPGYIHAKTILIDEATAIIWSANLTRWSFDILKETNAIFRNWNWVVNELKKQLKKDMNASENIDYSNIPKFSRIKSWLQEIFI